MAPIDVHELSERLITGESLNLLDVREVIEFHTYNIGGKNIPVSKVTESINELGYNKTDEIIVICRAGIRSETARLILMENGFEQVRNLTGGLMALQKLKQ
jgi:rhodanese-related sulfurtransferase